MAGTAVVIHHNKLSGEGTWALLQMRDEVERNAARINNELALMPSRRRSAWSLKANRASPGGDDRRRREIH
jgi:hypothetical protein